LSASNAPGHDGRVVTEAIAVIGVAAALYSKAQGWPALRLGLDRALDGDGSILLQLADSLIERRPDGYSNQTESNLAINCVDRPSPKQVAAYREDAREFARESPHFGALIGFGSLPCAFWPTSAVTRPEPLRAAGAAPILVVGTTRDPATPYVWAQNLARQLDSGVLLTYQGDGHTIWGTGESNCVDRIGNAYLLELEVPRDGTTC
jgi:pimeloyl-ACP methyl ester carboxylesterase